MPRYPDSRNSEETSLIRDFTSSFGFTASTAVVSAFWAKSSASKMSHGIMDVAEPNVSYIRTWRTSSSIIHQLYRPPMTH
jgi:hypothetical protein